MCVTADALDYEGALSQLRAALEALPDMALACAQPAMLDAVTYLHEQWPDYPSQPSAGAPSPLITVKQKRWFFAAVKAGKIPGWKWVDGHPEGHYTRTGLLGQRMTESVERTGDGVFGYFGTNLGYAPWVIGPAYPGETINGRTMYQARIHKGRWPRLPDFVEQHLPGAWARFDETFFAKLEEAWNNHA